MNKEYADKWIEALRSGKYEQGKYQLRGFDQSFCCLGVLCDVAAPELWTKGKDYGYFCDGVENAVPLSVQRLVGLQTARGYLRDPVISSSGEDSRSLVTLNDRVGATFMEIADVIEQKWKQL